MPLVYFPIALLGRLRLLWTLDIVTSLAIVVSGLWFSEWLFSTESLMVTLLIVFKFRSWLSSSLMTMPLCKARSFILASCELTRSSYLSLDYKFCLSDSDSSLE